MFGLAVTAALGCRDKGASPARAPAPSAPTGTAGSEAQSPPAAVPSAGLGKMTIRVSGNRFIDGTNGLLDLHGANHSGTEFACVQGWGLFSGPGDESVFEGMQKWKLNAVRIPLNENCWLGINGVDAQHGGDTYRNAIVNWVSLAHKHGLIAILDLHWSAPGAHKSMEQQPMADADHALDFWKSVATTFKADHALVFDLFNEPYLNHFKLSTDAWSCWLDGCTVTGGEGGLSGTWRSAGMQAMLDAVRSAGATQPVMAGGLEWGNDLTGWLAHMPKDRLQQVAAGFHQYQGNMCQDMLCWESTLHPILSKVPLVTGELGESDCGHAFTDKYMDWADSVHASYAMWAWNAWGDPSPTSCGSEKYPMIADWQGTPTPYGASYKARLAR
jgi:endoglucanase